MNDSIASSFTHSFNQGVKILALFLYVLMILVVGLQILTRWVIGSVIGNSLPWTVNLSQMLLVYITFIGAAVASRDHKHISLDILSSRLSDGQVRILVGVQSILALAFIIVLVLGAYPLYQQNTDSVIGALPTYPPFTQAWLYVPVVVGGFIIAVYELRDIWGVVTAPEAALKDFSNGSHDED